MASLTFVEKPESFEGWQKKSLDLSSDKPIDKRISELIDSLGYQKVEAYLEKVNYLIADFYFKEIKTMKTIKPAGYKMLIKPLLQEQVSEGGIVLATDEEQKRQQAGFPIFEVLQMGPACYKTRDGQEFPEGPWCKVGDTIVLESYPGKAYQAKEFYAVNSGNAEALEELQKMQKLGQRFHIITDDSVHGVLEK